MTVREKLLATILTLWVGAIVVVGVATYRAADRSPIRERDAVAEAANHLRYLELREEQCELFANLPQASSYELYDCGGAAPTQTELMESRSLYRSYRVVGESVEYDLASAGWAVGALSLAALVLVIGTLVWTRETVDRSSPLPASPIEESEALQSGSEPPHLPGADTEGPESPSGSGRLGAELRELAALRDEGLLTDAEFAEQKQRLLSSS